MEKYKEEFLTSTEVNGNKVCPFRKYGEKGKPIYQIHWGEDPQCKLQLLSPKGKKYKEDRAIKQFFQAVKAAKHLTFTKK